MKKKVLIVEDEFIVANNLRQALQPPPKKQTKFSKTINRISHCWISGYPESALASTLPGN